MSKSFRRSSVSNQDLHKNVSRIVKTVHSAIHHCLFGAFIFSDLIFYLFFRLPQIYEEFYHTVNNADHEKDLKWWSNTYGVNMPMNWPQFEVCKSFFFS